MDHHQHGIPNQGSRENHTEPITIRDRGGKKNKTRQGAKARSKNAKKMA